VGEEFWDCEVASDCIVMDGCSVSSFVVSTMRDKISLVLRWSRSATQAGLQMGHDRMKALWFLTAVAWSAGVERKAAMARGFSR